MKPTAVILDLLRTYGHKGTTVKSIMATGAMFDFSENLMRVSLSRLVNRGKVENFKRGHYRLTDHTDPMNDFVEQWRLGEARVREWDSQSWLLVHAADAVDARRDWALDALGYRQVSPGLWARPENLAMSSVELERRLHGLGVDRTSVLISAARIGQRWQAAWREHFDFEALTGRYRGCREQLLESLSQFDSMDREAAMKESFHLGGTAVHILAKDPLLPAQMMDTTPRRALWQTMLDYDRKGREIWSGRGKDRPEIMPTPQLEFSN